MAIAQMKKVMIATHRSEAALLLEAIQQEGIMEVLDADKAMVSKDWPELQPESARPRDLQDLTSRLTKSVSFLQEYRKEKKGLASMLSPRAVVEERFYSEVVSGREALEILKECEEVREKITQLNGRYESCRSMVENLEPWIGLTTPIEEIGKLQRTTSLLGLIPGQHFEQAASALGQLSAAVEQAGTAGGRLACVIVCLKENVRDVQKVLRAADFEPVSFESMTGTVAEAYEKNKTELNEISKQLHTEFEKATELGKERLKLQILLDHYENLLKRQQVQTSAPATEQTVLLEGWVRKTDYDRLESVVSKFSASSLMEMEQGQDEEVPVEITNTRSVRPFEVITRLYGMPQHFEVDPTAFLAPFFALFFALCLTDAGYGLLIIGFIAFFIKKIQGDKKLMWMLGICSTVTLIAGALTGGWFGDAIQQFIPVLAPVRQKLMWFDPLEKPMTFFVLALGVGYLQIIVGLSIAFVHQMVRRDFVGAVCEKLTWLVMLNSLMLFGFSKAGMLPAVISRICVWTAAVPAVMIVFFSERQGGWAGRIGMGCYQLFSTIFYVGDVLSYLRLMALGMVTAGLAMAINVIGKIVGGVPYIGVILALIVLAFGHLFNTAISGLSAFVHTLRLQYVEFFPKFLVGGGRTFEPLGKQYKNIYIVKSES
jgi:V/A-type H+-transporting ATPase subunit I